MISYENGEMRQQRLQQEAERRAGLPVQLREAEDEYVQRGFAFSYNREMIFSFDVCGSCESARMLGVTGGQECPRMRA